MLANIRKFAKSWVALVFIGLLVISFAIFGIGDVFQPRTGDWVVKAGSRTVTGVEFQRLFDNYKQQVQQQMGQPLTNQQLVERGIHERMLQDLAVRESFLEALRRMGIMPSDELVLGEISKAPIFFDPITGRFDQDAYRSQLQQNDLTPEQFEGYLRDEIAEQHYGTAVLAGLKAPRVFAAAAQAFESEVRDVAFALVLPTMVEQPGAPTDAQLTAFMQENAERLRRPEMRALTVVRFDPANVANQVQVDPAEVQRQFAFRQDSLSQAERRTLIQVPARNAQAAAQAAQRMRAGQDAAAVARSLNVEPIRHNNVAQSAIPDRRVAEAAFRLQPGQVSDPIQGELGFSVVQVTAVTPGKTVTIEEVRPQIEAALRADAAAERINEVIQRFEDSKESGATLPEAARGAGVVATSLAPVTAQGRDQNGGQVALEPELLRAAYELPAGGESETIDIGQGRYAAVRVDRIIPAALPSLQEVRGPLAQAWQARELVRRMQARAEALAAQTKAGGSLQTLAQQAGAQFITGAGLSRGSTDVPPEVLGQAFQTKQGGVFTAATAQAGVIVGRVNAVRFVPPPVTAAMVAQRLQALTIELTEQLGEAVRRAPSAKIKTRTNPERARAALGVAAEEPAKGEK